MANTILTPVTLWKDFEGDLPLEAEVISERIEDGCIDREVRFSGRRSEEGRVRIWARYTVPEGLERFPAVLVLSEVGHGPDPRFIRRFTENGYGVLCVDYAGETPDGDGAYTIYPKDIDYANYVRAGRHLTHADPTAKETCWYEWAAVARYAVRYLSEQPQVSKVGAIGIRTGGEVLYKIAPYAPISCMVSICAAGWLAYRNVETFSGEGFNEERHRFIAGIDSQSYAPHVKCPVLLLAAVNDRKYYYDRAYDMFRQINPEVEKALLYSARGNGLIGSHSFINILLFLDKYLKERSVFISKPISFTADEEDGNLVIRASFDAGGEIKEYGLFYSEQMNLFRTRDWTRVMGRLEDLKDGVGTIPLSLYEGGESALVYTFVNYSNGFSVTSKIQSVQHEKHYKNSRLKSRVIYSSSNGVNGFSTVRTREKAIADCFADGSDSEIQLAAGYGGILGITSESGLLSYRVGDAGYSAPDGAMLRFDMYAEEDVAVVITFYTDEELKTGYSCRVNIQGKGGWKNFVLSTDDFKEPETGASLPSFRKTTCITFQGDEKFVLNNIIWL